MLFFDAVSTGHRGYATVHADSYMTTIDRLITLMKRDIKAQMYTDKYLGKLLAMSIDLIIFMKNFKIHEVSEVMYDKERDEIIYNPLFEFEVEKYEDGKSVGKFKRINVPKGRVFEKIKLSEIEIDKQFA